MPAAPRTTSRSTSRQPPARSASRFRSSPAGAIHGRIDTNGRPPSDFTIVLAPVFAEPGAPVQAVLPDADSRFVFQGLRPGRYRIAVKPTAEASRSRWLGDGVPASEIDVPPGAPVALTLAAPQPDGAQP